MSLETLSLQAQLLNDYAKRYPSDTLRAAVTKAAALVTVNMGLQRNRDRLRLQRK